MVCALLVKEVTRAQAVDHALCAKNALLLGSRLHLILHI